MNKKDIQKAQRAIDSYQKGNRRSFSVLGTQCQFSEWEKGEILKVYVGLNRYVEVRVKPVTAEAVIEAVQTHLVGQVMKE